MLRAVHQIRVPERNPSSWNKDFQLAVISVGVAISNGLLVTIPVKVCHSYLKALSEPQLKLKLIWIYPGFLNTHTYIYTPLLQTAC